jgi:glycosyltransferase involved in cell wall biosynthesis
LNVLIIADVFPPLRSSGAVQLRDLAKEFARQGHSPTVLVASPDSPCSWIIEEWQGVRVVRLRTPRTKDVGYLRRTLGEFLMPFHMLAALRSSPVWDEHWEGVIWYSPTIFLGPVARRLKSRRSCRGYLIVRDIFPEWAADMGLMGRGLPYFFFKAVAAYQYRVADVIGVQTKGNLAFFAGLEGHTGRRVEVLRNWLADTPATQCSIKVATTSLVGRRIFVYAGNMGVAQGAGVLLHLAAELRTRTDVGFILVGRGSDAGKLRQQAADMELHNVVFFDEIDPDEIPGLYSQCHVGVLALDPRHKTHNIPGKLLSYLQSGLPVLAIVNPGNDVIDLIESERIGATTTEVSAQVLAASASRLLSAMEVDDGYATRCRDVSSRLFSVNSAVQQLVSGLRA